LAASVVVAVTAAAVSTLKAPGWVTLVVAVGAPCAGVLIAEIKARGRENYELAALIDDNVSVKADRRGRCPRVADVTQNRLGVHAAVAEVAYVRRSAGKEVEAALDSGQPVLILGESMAGKTRLAVEVLRHRYGRRGLVVPDHTRKGSARALLDARLDLSHAVMWLDDLDRYLGDAGLTVGRLADPRRPVMIATMRLSEYEKYRPRGAVRPPEWEVLRQFTSVRLSRRLDETEWAEAERVISGELLARCKSYGLTEYLGGGLDAQEMFLDGEYAEPVGYALVCAAIDWRRAGMRTVARADLEALLPAYLSLDDPAAPSAAAVDQALAWAQAAVNSRVALVAGDETRGYVAFDYLVDYRTGIHAAIPDDLWQRVLAAAQPADAGSVGHAARALGRRDISEEAFCRAVDTGSTSAMTALGELLQERGEQVDAEALFRRAAQAGDAAAARNLGLLMEQRGIVVDAEAWWRQAAGWGDVAAMNRLAVLLQTRGGVGDLDEAEMWSRKAADGGDVAAMNRLAVLLQTRGQPADLDEAEGLLREVASRGPAAMEGVTRAELGRLLVRRGRLDEALSQLHRAVAVTPTAETHQALAEAYAYRGNWDKAILHIRSAIGQAPSAELPRCLLAIALAVDGRWQDTVQEAEIAVSRYPASTLSWAALSYAQVASRKGQPKGVGLARARWAADRCVALDPTAAISHVAQHIVRSEMSNSASILPDAAYMAAATSSTIEPIRWLAAAQHSRGDPVTAVFLYDLVVAVDPQDQLAWARGIRAARAMTTIAGLVSRWSVWRIPLIPIAPLIGLSFLYQSVRTYLNRRHLPPLIKSGLRTERLWRRSHWARPLVGVVMIATGVYLLQTPLLALGVGLIALWVHARWRLRYPSEKTAAELSTDAFKLIQRDPRHARSLAWPVAGLSVAAFGVVGVQAGFVDRDPFELTAGSIVTGVGLWLLARWLILRWSLRPPAARTVPETGIQNVLGP
jgi:tetratricopeptide (TPR) repeat protein